MKIFSSDSVNFTDAVIRANKLIDIIATDQIDLTRASIGIVSGNKGDIKVRSVASTIDLTDAVLKRPDDLILDGIVVGTPADDTQGTLPCP